MNISLRAFAFAALVLLAVANARAGEIPKGYRGVYRDAASTVRLELKESKALLEVGGAAYKADVERESYAKVYEGLLKGKPFLYIPQPRGNAGTLEVYWVTPNLSTQKAEGGLTAYRADIIYMRLNREQPTEVASLKIVHSKDGMVMLDTVKRVWQAGWGAEFGEYDLRRVSERG